MALMRVAETSSRADPISRRAFFTLRGRASKRVLELSCERLYMRYVDARAAIGRAQAADRIETRPRAHAGEPALAVEAPTVDALFASLENELAQAQVLVVLESEWLTSRDFGRELEPRIEAFRKRGGEVRLGNTGTTSSVTAQASMQGKRG